MEMTDIRSLSADELQEKLDQVKKELMQSRFQAKTGKLERQSTLAEKKKDIARILTVINEKKVTEVSQ